MNSVKESVIDLVNTKRDTCRLAGVHLGSELKSQGREIYHDRN